MESCSLTCALDMSYGREYSVSLERMVNTLIRLLANYLTIYDHRFLTAAMPRITTLAKVYSPIVARVQDTPNHAHKIG